MAIVSADFGEGLLQKYGKLRFVSTPKGKPETTVEMWTLELLIDTIYIVTVNGEVKQWSDTHSIFGWYQMDDDFEVVNILPLP